MARPKKTASTKWRKLRRFRLRKRVYRNKHGYLKLTRRLPEIAYGNTSIAGNGIVTDSTGTCLNATIIGLTTGAASGSNLYDIAWSLNFRLDQLLSYTDITGIADKYRIKGAYVRLFYNNTVNSGTNNTLAGLPYIQYVTDNDDKIVPSIGLMREKMGVKTKSFRNGSSFIGMMCRPTPTAEVFATGVLSGYEILSKAPWLDCASPNVEHYGLKGIIYGMPLPASASATSLLKFDVQLVVEAKDFQ